jgi:hypothetical protein
MRAFALFLCSCAFLLPYSASAAAISDAAPTETAEGLPPVILAGLKSYKDDGPDEAVSIWIKGSALDGSKEASLLHRMQASYGTYRNFNVIGSRDLGSRTRILYLTLDFDKGPLFAKFVAYKSDQGWILMSFDFYTNSDDLPSFLFPAAPPQP